MHKIRKKKNLINFIQKKKKKEINLFDFSHDKSFVVVNDSAVYHDLTVKLQLDRQFIIHNNFKIVWLKTRDY